MYASPVVSTTYAFNFSPDTTEADALYSLLAHLEHVRHPLWRHFSRLCHNNTWQKKGGRVTDTVATNCFHCQSGRIRGQSRCFLNSEVAGDCSVKWMAITRPADVTPTYEDSVNVCLSFFFLIRLTCVLRKDGEWVCVYIAVMKVGCLVT